MIRAVILAGILVVVSGCRTGWVRAGATEMEFLRDYDCCRYGCDQEQQTLEAGGRQQQGDAARRAKRDYKLCLRLRGWHPVRGKGFRP